MSAFGITAIRPGTATHALGFATPLATSDAAMLEVWNGPSNSSRKFRLNKDGQVQLQDGTVGAPAFSFESDKDTGIYRTGANAFSLVANGAAVVAVATTGITVTGAVTATSLSGTGASITALNADNVASGNLAYARMPSAAGTWDFGTGILDLTGTVRLATAKKLQWGTAEWITADTASHVMTFMTFNNGFVFANSFVPVVMQLDQNDVYVYRNFLVGLTAGAGSGEGVIGLKNATTNPSTNPSGGGVIYCDGGALKYRGSSGTVTTLANA